MTAEAQFTMTAEAQFTITTETYRVDTIREKLAELNKRAIKLGVPELVLTVANVRIEREEREQFYPPKTIVVEREICDVTVSGAAPVLDGGWSLCGTIDHNGKTDGSANLLLGNVPEEYRKARPVCDHCGKLRKRTETFVVKSEAGKLVQVARQCIKNYLPVDVKRIVRWAELAREVREMDSWGGGVSEPDKVIDFLAACACSIRLNGWVSRGFAMDHQWATPTAADASHIMHPSREQIRDGWVSPVIEADYERAQAALNWLRDLPELERGTDYLANLFAAATTSIYLPSRHSGLVASLVGAAYPKAMNEERKKREVLPASLPVGNCGDRLRGLAVICYAEPRYYPNDYNGSTMVRLRTLEGSDLFWWASGDRVNDFEVGARYTLDASVKAQRVSDYTKRMETVLTRVQKIQPMAQGDEQVAQAL